MVRKLNIDEIVLKIKESISMTNMINILKIINFHSGSQIANLLKCRFAQRQEVLKYNPTSLTLFISDRCNLNCNMCLNHSKNRPEDHICKKEPCLDMNFDTFKSILNNFNNACFLCLAGRGEPFLNNDIFEMIKYGSNQKMKISVITNGTLLSDKIDQIIDSKLNSIEISLDAFNPAEYKKMHNASDKIFYSVVDNIRELVEKRDKKIGCRLNIGVSYICANFNYKNISEVIRLAEDLQIDSLMFHNLLPFGILGFSDDECLYDDDPNVLDVIQKINRSRKKINIFLPRIYKRNSNARLCNWYFSNLNIDSEGNVSSCGAKIPPNKKYGNIFRDNDVWNKKHFKQMRRMFLDNKIQLLDCCKICPNNSYDFKTVKHQMINFIPKVSVEKEG